MRIVSPAKINLHLRVGPLGADGFHPLMSWMCTVGLADTMDFTASDRRGVMLTCDRPDVPTDRTNLIVRAGEALAAAADYAGGAHIRLQKKIPLGGGLGGGSSNGASALIGLNRLWQTTLPLARLDQIGAMLGSDVPFFFHGNSSICTGRGEYVTPISPPRPRVAVLMFPNFSMPTPAVYRKFDEMRLASAASLQQPNWAKWSMLPADQLLPLLVNDLEVPSFSICPELGELRQKSERELGRIVRMSGSGSTLFTLFDERGDADEAMARIARLSMRAEVHELAPSAHWDSI